MAARSRKTRSKGRRNSSALLRGFILVPFHYLIAMLPLNPKSKKIAILVAMRCPEGIINMRELPFFRCLFASLLNTTSGGFDYGVFIGIDPDDPMLANPKARYVFEQVFHRIALDYSAKPSWNLETLLVLDGCRHRPCWVWNRLAREARSSGYDFFYQIGDDVSLWCSGWTERFVGQLEKREGLGVVGAIDRHNPKLLTQGFVSVRHVDLFGGMFATEFTNWYSDNWLQDIYAPDYSHIDPQSEIVNGSQSGLWRARGGPRYQRDLMTPEDYRFLVAIGRRHWRRRLDSDQLT